MAKRYFRISKYTTFQGREEEWSNVYLMETDADDSTEYTAIINALVAAEKLIHSGAVTFRRADVYTTWQLNGLSDFGTILFNLDLSGAGSGSSTIDMYKECAFLVKWPLPRRTDNPITGNKRRSLKKWLHTVANLGASAAAIAGNATLTSTTTTPLLTYANTVENPVTGTYLIAPDGATPSGDAVVHPYIEHRQFPRGRKEAIVDL